MMTALRTTLVEAISFGRSGQEVFLSSAWTSCRYLTSFWKDPSFFAGAGLAGPAIFTPSFRLGGVVPFLSVQLVVMGASSSRLQPNNYRGEHGPSPPRLRHTLRPWCVS